MASGAPPHSNISISSRLRPRWRGFSFALHLTRCKAFILPGCNTALYKRSQRVLPCQCNYTAHATKQRTGLYSGFSSDCARSTAHDTRPTQADITPPVPRWNAYQRPDTLHLYQIPPPRRDAVQVSIAAYYNKVYRRVQGRALPWIHARRCNISQTMPARRVSSYRVRIRWQVLTRCQQYRPGAPADLSARRGLDASHVRRLEVWHRVNSQGGHPPPGGAVQQQGSGGRRGTIGGSRRISFRAFAR